MVEQILGFTKNRQHDASIPSNVLSCHVEKGARSGTNRSPMLQGLANRSMHGNWSHPFSGFPSESSIQHELRYRWTKGTYDQVDQSQW